MINEYHESQYWDDAKYIFWDRSILTKYGANNEALNVLCERGIPSWVAPNMYFGLYAPVGTSLKLGEDRDDNDIVLSLNTGVVTVGKLAKFMNSDVSLMRITLQFYAVMIEKALEVDEEAIIKNNIDSKLIEEFRHNLYSIDNFATEPKSFWFDDIHRLLKR